MIHQHPPIYWASVYLNTEVHMQALGFTKTFYKYACANSLEEAAKTVELWVIGKGLDLKKVVVERVAVNQDLRTYTFPEQILNLPADVLEAEYDRREYPESYRTPGQMVDLNKEISNVSV